MISLIKYTDFIQPDQSYTVRPEEKEKDGKKKNGKNERQVDSYIKKCERGCIEVL